jgi:hypothetical protein
MLDATEIGCGDTGNQHFLKIDVGDKASIFLDLTCHHGDLNKLARSSPNSLDSLQLQVSSSSLPA